MNYKDVILSYVPINLQEIKDKQTILNYIEKYGDFVLDRKNNVCHLTVSAWITNKNHDKVLLNFHKLYNNWGWLGGHQDNELDPLFVILKEIKEESGLTNLKLLDNNIISLEILSVFEHYKKNILVPAHLHLNLTYLFEANENDTLIINEEENSGLIWIDLDEVLNMTNEEHMKPIYEKLNKRIRNLK